MRVLQSSVWDYWPFFTLVLLGGIIGLAFALPSSELAMVTAFILGGAVGSSSDVPVFLSAIMIGAIV